MQQPTAFPLVEVSGAPRERGRQYGEAAAERVARSVALYSEALGKLGLSGAALDEIVDGFLPQMRDWAPDLIEEMEGIAEGAGCGLTSVVLVNARTEVLQLAKRRAGITPDQDPDGCTGAVILPEAAREGRLIHGQNWDWRAECADSSVVLKVRREKGPDFLTFTEAGALARSGFNAAGIAITANYLECDRDYARLGIPLPLIRRRVLEAAHYAEALRVVATTPKSGSNNMMVSTAEGDALDLECAPDETFTLYPEDGLLVHANHWQSTVALSKLRETGLMSVPDSLYRDRRVARHLAGRRGELTREDLKVALFDDFATPFSVCRPPIAKEGGNLSASVAMVIMEPALGLMEIAPLPALGRSFTSYRLEMDAGSRAAA